MSLWFFLTSLGHLPFVPLSHSIFIVNKSLRWKKVASTYATRQSVKEGFPSTGNVKGNEPIEPKARNKLGKNSNA